MIRLTEQLWIGDSADGRNLEALGITAILNVAHDLRSFAGWPEVEYAQVGLIDGPGNLPAAYHATILTLISLLGRHKQVLVCCHTGSRSMAVALMYLNLTFARGWDSWLDVLNEYVDLNLPEPHAAHRIAFDAIQWESLRGIVS